MHEDGRWIAAECMRMLIRGPTEGVEREEIQEMVGALLLADFVTKRG